MPANPPQEKAMNETVTVNRRVAEAVGRLDLKQAMSIGLTDGDRRRVQGALDSPPAETVTEYRVVADPMNGQGMPEYPVHGPGTDRSRAERALAGFNPVGFNTVYENARIQERTLTRSPWTEVDR